MATVPSMPWLATTAIAAVVTSSGVCMRAPAKTVAAGPSRRATSSAWLACSGGRQDQGVANAELRRLVGHAIERAGAEHHALRRTLIDEWRDGHRSPQIASHPPSMARTWPVTMLEARLAR